MDKEGRDIVNLRSRIRAGNEGKFSQPMENYVDNRPANADAQGTCA